MKCFLQDVKIAGILLLIAVVIGVGVNCVRPNPLPWWDVPKSERLAEVLSAIPVITVDELREFVRGNANVVILDARGESFYRRGHIVGALNLDVDEFAARYPALKERLAKAEKIVVYCADVHCELSGELAKLLLEKGHANILHYPGGWEAWKGNEIIEN